MWRNENRNRSDERGNSRKSELSPFGTESKSFIISSISDVNSQNRLSVSFTIALEIVVSLQNSLSLPPASKRSNR